MILAGSNKKAYGISNLAVPIFNYEFDNLIIHSPTLDILGQSYWYLNNKKVILLSDFWQKKAELTLKDSPEFQGILTKNNLVIPLSNQEIAIVSKDLASSDVINLSKNISHPLIADTKEQVFAVLNKTEIAIISPTLKKKVSSISHSYNIKSHPVLMDANSLIFCDEVGYLVKFSFFGTSMYRSLQKSLGSGYGLGQHVTIGVGPTIYVTTDKGYLLIFDQSGNFIDHKFLFKSAKAAPWISENRILILQEGNLLTSFIARFKGGLFKSSDWPRSGQSNFNNNFVY